MFPGDRFDINTNKPVNKYKYTKTILLVVASFALVLVVFWPSLKEMYDRYTRKSLAQNEATVTHLSIDSGPAEGGVIKNQAKDIRFHGTDKSNQPYILIAVDGNENEDQIVFLTRPHLTLTLTSGETATLNSNHGTYDKIKSLVKLEGDVVVTHSVGYQFLTSLAWIDLTQLIAYGEDKVTGEGPKGTIQASGGFRLSDKGDKIMFFGRPELILKK